ncbi:MAG: SBBP repeat-containing protein [Anaerolineae bacterium]|nr:SBBP repeat-containing protein [Anaerolineae bacterium]
MIRRILTLSLVCALPLLLVGLVTAVFARTPSTDYRLPISDYGLPIYGTYLGGDLPDYGHSIAVDQAGGVYVVGRSESTNFPTGTQTLAPNHGIDAFIAKFNPDGSQAEYIFWFYTQVFFALDEATDVVVDDQGYAYVVGNTASDDFCSLFGDVPGYDTTYNDSGDGFLLKVQADGSGLVYCTFLGGSEPDRAMAVAIDSEGNAYVTGSTTSTDFITSTNSVNNQPAGGRDMFLLVLDAAGTAVLHASRLGGSNQEEGRAITLDDAGNAYTTGWTNSEDFTTTVGVLGPTLQGDFDAFLMSINVQTPTLRYATYLGGSGEDRAYGLTVDAEGNAHVGGVTYSADFPTTLEAFAVDFSGVSDGFVAKVNPQATAFRYSTFLGGSLADQVNGLTLDADNNLFATGETWSADFPVSPDAWMPDLTGGQSAFMTVLNPTGRQLAYGTFVGGNNWDKGLALDRSDDGRIYLAGATLSTDFPVSANAYAITHSGEYDAYFTSFVVTVTNHVASDFTAVPTIGPAPLTVQFTNLSVGENLTAAWQFGDGQTSTDFNPSHTYTQPGSYTVTLTVAGPDGVDSVSQPNAVRVWWPVYLPFIRKP